MSTVRGLLVLAALAPLTACGAGIIAAVFAGSRGGSDPPSTPTITVSQPVGPLWIEPEEFYLRSAVLRGARIPADAEPEVRLAADVGGQVVESVQVLLRVEGSGDDTTLAFALRTDAIVAAVGDPRVADVPADLVVLAVRETGATEMFRTPFTLLRQPTAELVPDDPIRGISVVSVLGGELTLSVIGLPTADPRDLVVEVVTGDPAPPPGQPAALLRRASNIRTESDPNDPERTTVRCTIPSWPFPTQAFARVTHTTAGRSSIVSELYYRPELNAVVSRRGTTDGGDLVGLSGSGLVPYDFTVQPAQLDFGSLRLFVQKGGAEVEVGAADLRPSSSSLNNVVFVTPPSPDGRPGPVTIRLSTQLPLTIDVEADGLFAYGAREPDFGPRGAILEATTVAADFGTRLAGVSPESPFDAAVVDADAAGVPIVRVLESRGNGTFSRLGLPIQAGDRGDLEQRFPIDLVWGEFHGDGYRDVAVVNRGSSRGAHTVLQGRDQTSEPLALSGVAFRTIPAPERAHIGRFDDDARDDVLVVGRTDAQRNTEYATPSGAGVFTKRPVFSTPVPLVEASAVVDLDGDGFQDLSFAAGGAAAEVRLAFGEPGSAFTDHRRVDLSGVPELVNGAVIGLGATGPAPDRTVVVVIREASGGAPSIVLLAPSAPRSYGATRTVVSLPPTGGDPVRSLSADLDVDGVDELIVARDPGGLTLWEWDGATMVERIGSVGLAPSDTGRVLDLDVGPAVDPAWSARLGVFVTHQVSLAGGSSPRVTTLLVDPAGPDLLDPFATRELPAAPAGIAIGEFAIAGPSSSTGDLLVASDGRFDVWANDGVGELTPDDMRSVAGIVPGSVTAVALTPGDLLDTAVFLLDDGRLGYRAPNGALAFSTARVFTGAGTVTGDSRLVAVDVDGDGRTDLALLLAVDRPPPVAAAERTLLLLRGRDPAVDPFPFIVPVPSAVTAVSPRAVSLALGDLAPDETGTRLEAAIAVRRDDAERGLLFYRLEPGLAEDDWALVRSVIEPNDPRVAADLDPALVLAADLEADGLADLVVVSGSLDVVQVFRQTGPSTRNIGFGEVDPLVFAPTDARVLPSGSPIVAHLADLDGDGIEDVVIQVLQRSGEHAIPVVISNGLAGFAGGFEVPREYVGSFGPDLATVVADVNGDSLADLVLAWSGDSGVIPPQLRVLFGTHR